MLHIPGLVSNSCIYDTPVPTWYVFMQLLTRISYDICPQYARSKYEYPTQLASMGFDDVFDLTADVYSFCNIRVYSCALHQVCYIRIYMHGTDISLTAVYRFIMHDVRLNIYDII